MDRDERRHWTDRFEALHLPMAALARAADVSYLRTCRFLTGGTKLAPDEEKRLTEAIARKEAIRQLDRAGAA